MSRGAPGFVLSSSGNYRSSFGLLASYLFHLYREYVRRTLSIDAFANVTKRGVSDYDPS